MIDYYSTSAEFYELVATRHTASSGPPLTGVLTGLDVSHGPVLEIGAGTGRVTEVIAAALPDAEILAAEPSATMRAMLTSRVARDPDLRRRVTVVDGSAQDLVLPERLSAVVIFGVVGHLTAPERVTLWKRLADRLPDGAPIVVELMGVSSPRVIPPVMSLRETIGRQTYEWWIGGEPTEGDGMRFTTTWKVLRDGRTVREVADSYEWHTFDVARLAREAGMTSRRITEAGGRPIPEIGVLVK
ncbi:MULTISPECIES: class I SAM-dependent methyltransferase [unclassified Streptomyces]|uniref:class I SAM-dependent methyltransferase n=1 Tax=unclassified Streptomyces TaxID=2593676 RepID=UPI000F6C2702|nr:MULTISPECIES: class I SAM-dependent methyltransferase [unclassified Streptomyces]AZM59571.1 class I SAM-dependent methyltransferase [Streptomyces sp. WAC 01438]RSM91996.1 class I SAM-dependent methyltransferase [Streptomyces sp. WAC 01420]